MINWKDIPGYEGFYQASECGQIRSVSRFVNTRHETMRFVNGRILIPRKKKKYLRVNVSANGIHKTFCVHQLIADAFLPNPNNYNSINHKDGNTENNHVANLEWCSIAYNNLHAYRILGKVNPMQGVRGTANPNSKPVICLTTNERFDNIREASERLKVFGTSIAKVCKGKGNHVGGLKFKYA